MLATGKLSQDAIPGGHENQEYMLGMEFSGTDMEGRRVMGMLQAKVKLILFKIQKLSSKGTDTALSSLCTESVSFIDGP